MTPQMRIMAVLLVTTACDDASTAGNRVASSPSSPEIATKGSGADRAPDTKDSVRQEPPKDDSSAKRAPAADPPKPATPSHAAEEPPADSPEKVGGLEVGMPLSRVKELLPGLKAKGKSRENEESGLFEQTWEDGNGVSVTMASEGRGGDQKLEVVHVSSPSKLKSALGVGIGDSVDAVKKAYGDVEVFDDELAYDMISFAIKDEKVASFSVGNLTCATCG